MGLRGPLTREAELIRQDEDAVVVPSPGVELDPMAQQEWEDFWHSKVSRYTDDVDMGALRRLFVYRNEWYQLMSAWMALPENSEEMEDGNTTPGRLVAGSRNADAVRLHPYAQRLDKLEALMLPLEDRFGLSALSRTRLGIEIGSLHLTWAAVNQRGVAPIEAGEVPRALPVSGAEVIDGPPE